MHSKENFWRPSKTIVLSKKMSDPSRSMKKELYIGYDTRI